MGSNGIFVTLMVLQRDTNTFCFSSSPDNINTDTTLSPQMSQPSESCWDRLLSKKGNRTLCLHFLKHHFTITARPQNPCRLQPSVVCQTARNLLTNTLRSWDSCWRIFFLLKLNMKKSFFCCKVAHENYQSILREFPYCSALNCLCFGDGVIDR